MIRWEYLENENGFAYGWHIIATGDDVNKSNAELYAEAFGVSVEEAEEEVYGRQRDVWHQLLFTRNPDPWVMRKGI